MVLLDSNTAPGVGIERLHGSLLFALRLLSA